MISPDLPITKSSDDKLNRSSFAKSLAQVLVQYTQPSSFTIGLYGEWGSGKTSLVNMILETIESIDNSAVIVRFNPWLCSEPKQLRTFIDTEQFLKISENEQMDAIAFLISLKSENKQSILDSHISEESIRKNCVN